MSGAVGGHRAPVGLHEMAHDGEAQSEATMLTCHGRVRLPEALEDVSALGRPICPRGTDQLAAQPACDYAWNLSRLLPREIQGAAMWFWLAGAIIVTGLVLVLLRLSSSEPDLGAVSDGWLARHKADRRSSDF